MHVSQRRTRCGALRRGFTLIEMLIAMALTLILVYAIAEFYAYVGDSVKDGRALIEMSSQMRSVTQRLKNDLDLVTVTVSPPVDDAWAPGYLTIKEGRGNDFDANGNGTIDNVEDIDADGTLDFNELNATNLLGDCDDYLAFTIRSVGDPWVGQGVQIDTNNGTMIVDSTTGEPLIEQGVSNVAEVAWWTSFTDIDGDTDWDVDEPRFLHRRQLLVRPDANRVRSGDMNYSLPYYVRIDANDTVHDYYWLMQTCDVSLRPIGVISGYRYYAANSLSDLARRENRFMHVLGGDSFPNALDLNPNEMGDRTVGRAHANNNFSLYRWMLAGDRRGEDVVLSNLLAFDIRVFDPTASIRADHGTTANANSTTQPGDIGYDTAATSGTPYPILGQGAYVDLWYNRYLTTGESSTFSAGPTAFGTPAQQTTYRNLLGATYDTWAASYDRDGYNQDYLLDGVADNVTAPFDEGTNGVDDDNANGVDDVLERETVPPYSASLRGLQIKLRTYEPGTRQVRQATVGADFIPD